MQTRQHIDRRLLLWVLVLAIGASALALVACAPDRPERTQTNQAIPEGTIDPEPWGEVYPQQYEDWQATAEARPPGSRYKLGGERAAEDPGPGEPSTHDKLSQYPFLAAMAKGIGFSVEFNEPRGHALALIDQNAIDPARLRGGGVCLACKSPYWEPLLEERGDEAYGIPYEEAMEFIPEEHRELGVTCIDCHNTEDASLRYSELMADGLRRIEAPEQLSEAETKNAVCGQCHSTYTIPKEEGVSAGLFLPWDGGSMGNITVEDIITTIESAPENREFMQTLTGLRLGYIRHPEYELYTNGDVHWRNGVTCVDCHQPYKVEGDQKVSDHNVMSPLDNEMRACRPCHPGVSEEQLREQVFHVQDQFIGGLLNAGYSTVSNAQLIRQINESDIDTQAAGVAEDYEDAVDAYKQAFYRVAYLAGENSVGFHNPPEAMRMLIDAQSFNKRADAVFRSLLEREGVRVPTEVDLNLREFMENRGERRLNFKPEAEFRDPRGIAERLWNDNLRRLREGGGGGEGGSQEATGSQQQTGTP